MSARDELREYADRYGYTEHVNALLDAFAAEVRREDIALIENAADDADFTEEPLYIVGLRSAVDLLKNAVPAVPVPDNTTGDEEAKAAVQYGIDFGRGFDITDGFDRELQEQRLGRWRDTHPDARLVQRTVRYGAWTEVTS